MCCYRITKYDPNYRNHNGHYAIDDWTSVKDVGEVFNGKKFSFHSYKLCEDSYINTINLILKENGIAFLQVENLEKYGFVIYADLNAKKSRQYYDNAFSGQAVYLNDINVFARLILREMLWCKLSMGSSFVHFGYDYYMYIGGVKELKAAELAAISQSGLFVEKMDSPY